MLLRVIAEVKAAASVLNVAQLCMLLASLQAAVRWLKRELRRRRQSSDRPPPPEWN